MKHFSCSPNICVSSLFIWNNKAAYWLTFEVMWFHSNINNLHPHVTNPTNPNHECWFEYSELQSKTDIHVLSFETNVRFSSVIGAVYNTVHYTAPYKFWHWTVLLVYFHWAHTGAMKKHFVWSLPLEWFFWIIFSSCGYLTIDIQSHL